MGGETFRRRKRDLAPERGRARRMHRERAQERVGRTRLARARERIDEVEIVKRLDVLVAALGDLRCHGRPAPAHMRAAQFKPAQCRDRADLLLREFGPHAPQPRIENVERARRLAEVEQKEQLMPPIVMTDENAAVFPGGRIVREEGDALGEPPLRFHHMRQRVMRPGFRRLERDRAPRRVFRFGEAVRLLQCEGVHSMRFGGLRVRRQDRVREAQHRRRVAKVERVILPPFRGANVGGRVYDRAFEMRDRRRNVVRRECGRRVDEGLFAGAHIRPSGQRPVEIGLHCRIAASRFQRHVNHRSMRGGDGAIRVRIRGGDDDGQFGPVSRPRARVGVEGGGRLGRGAGQSVSEGIVCHGAHHGRWL